MPGGGWGGGLWGGGRWGGTSGGGAPFAPDGEYDALSVDPGVEAGRVPGVIGGGSYLFALGHDPAGFFGFLSPGDHVQVDQSFTPTGGMDAVTFFARLRPPIKAPGGDLGWKASILIDGSEVSSRAFPAAGAIPQDFSTWLIDTSKLAGGAHDFAFRLTMTGTAGVGPYPIYEVEIPAFYVDAVVESAIASPSVENMVPEVNAGISSGPAPIDTTAIDFDIIDFGTNGIDNAHTTVTVNGVIAILSGATQSGFTAMLTTTNKTLHVHLVRALPFASASTVTVRVQSQTLVGAVTVDRTYVFAVADIVPPVITAASAQTTKTILVSWSKSVREVSIAGAHDATNAALYVLAPTLDGLHPAVTPLVVQVDAVSASAVLLTTDTELSPGIVYMLTATGVADLSGNTTTTSATFTAFVPPSPALRVWDLYKKLPEKNRIEDYTQDLLRFILCLQEVSDLLIYSIDTWTDILDVDTAPDEFLDAMLDDLGNPFPFVLTTTQKRQLLRVIVSLYKQKGTAIGIINAVRFFLGLTVTISFPNTGSTMLLGVSHLGVDWVLGSGARRTKYSFSAVSGIALTADQIAKITTIARYMKVAHEHFLGVVVPIVTPVYDPLVLGVSRLGVDWLLH